MNYLLAILFLLTTATYAQPPRSGLGRFRIGVTTPDSLAGLAFHEQELVVLKGTLAMPCAQVRVFQADSLQVEGVAVTDLFLVFYENRLFRITCTLADSQRQRFSQQYGIGRIGTPGKLHLCDQPKRPVLLLENESWQTGTIQALLIRAHGLNAQCQMETVSRLTIVHLPELAITSECDLDYLDPYFDEVWKNR